VVLEKKGGAERSVERKVAEWEQSGERTKSAAPATAPRIFCCSSVAVFIRHSH